MVIAVYPFQVRLDSFGRTIDNNGMETIPGRVKNGVVVLEGGVSLPEGTVVSVARDLAPPVRKKHRVVLPLVKSKHPGTLQWTNERIAEILEEEDVAKYSKFLKCEKS